MFGCGSFFQSCGEDDEGANDDQLASDDDTSNAQRDLLLHGLCEIVDQNNNDELNIEELRAITPDAEAFMAVMDTDKDNVITMKEFKQWSEAHLIDYVPADHVARLNKLIRLARCGKQIKNAADVTFADLFHALDMNDDSELSLDEIRTVVGPDAPHFTHPLNELEKDGTIDERDFCLWCANHPLEYQTMLAVVLEINNQAVFGVWQLYNKFVKMYYKNRSGGGGEIFHDVAQEITC
jgi:hypothetical protein